MGTRVDSFGSRLRDELTARNLSIRALATRLTVRDPGRMESVRRRLNKYVNEGVTPTDGARREIESVLGLDPDSLLVEAEDDEDPSLEATLFRVVELLRAEMRAGQTVERKQAEAAA